MKKKKVVITVEGTEKAPAKFNIKIFLAKKIVQERDLSISASEFKTIRKFVDFFQ